MTLTALADRVQALTSACREMDEAITLALNPQQVTRHIQSGEIINVPEWTRSLDLVVTLVPENWYWAVGRTSLFCGWAKVYQTHPDHTIEDENEFFANCEHWQPVQIPPLNCLLACVLRARASKAYARDRARAALENSNG